MYFHPLNFIRFILALGVILFHYGLSYYPFNHPAIAPLIANSAFRVSFFFFISGFVMCMVYARQADGLTASYFYKRRFTRIFPVYFFAFLLTLLGVVFLKDAAPKGLNILLHALGLQSLNPGHVLDLNYPTWSISVELIFYLLFPFFLKWIIKLSVNKLVIITVLLWLLQSLQHILFVEYLYSGTKISEEFISTFPIWHLTTFFSGMAASRLIALDAFPARFSKYAILTLLLAVLIFIWLLYFPNPILKYIHNGLLSPLFLLVIVSLYYDRSALNTFLSNKHVSRLGDFSYGLFIFQYPVWLLMTWMADETIVSKTYFFFAYLFVLLGFSWLVNRFFEKPLLKRMRK